MFSYAKENVNISVISDICCNFARLKVFCGLMDSKEIQKIKLRFGIIGNSDELNRAIDVAMQVAPTDLSVLVTGESGVGRSTFLR